MSAAAPTFGRLLADGRAGFNARVAATASRHPPFDAAAFGDFLLRRVGPVVEAVAAVAPDAAGATTVAAFDIALDLAAGKQIGREARSAALDQAWEALLPPLAVRIADQPAAVIAAVCNAVLHLERAGAAQRRRWMGWMQALGPRAGSLQDLRTLGQVLAWRAGLAHFRQGALLAAATLPPALALAALNAAPDADWPAVLQKLHADPWWFPDPQVSQQALCGMEIGAFSGFGGSFAEPPQARAAGDGFILRSGGHHFRLAADACGWTLLPATPQEFAAARTAAAPPSAEPNLSGDQLRCGARSWTLDLPASAIDLAVGDHAIAVTSPYSFALRLFPRELAA